MVIASFQRLVTSLKRILFKQDSITLHLIPDHGISFMQKYILSSEQSVAELMALPSTWDVLIGEEDWQKLRRAGLAHLLLEELVLDEPSTPQQMEFDFKTTTDTEKA